jgi:hypothetical protein
LLLLPGSVRETVVLGDLQEDQSGRDSQHPKANKSRD